MKILYKDDKRKHLVAQGIIDLETKNSFQQLFNHVMDSYYNRKVGWIEWFDRITFGNYKRDRTTLVQNYNTLNLNNNIIVLSLHLLKSIGVDANVKGNKGNRVRIKYQEMCLDDDFETDFDKQHYYHFNSEDGEDEEDDGYGCIFCIKKDSDVKDGQLVFYPRFLEDMKENNYMLCCMPPQQSSDLPIEEGSVTVLTGSTYHNIPKITGRGVMRLITVIFSNKETDTT